MEAETVVIAALAAGRPAPSVPELIAFAKALQRDGSLPVRVLVLGEGIAAAAAEIAELSGATVTGFDGKALAAYSGEAWRDVLAPCLAGISPRFVLIAHDALGADFAPGLAARLEAACITSVDGFRVGEEGILFTRPLLKGKMKMDIVPETETTVVTLLAGAFRGPEAPEAPVPGAAAQKDDTRPGKAEILPVPDLPLSTRPLGHVPAPEEAADLAAAEVIVAAGRGIGNGENIALLSRLASCFSHSALGASRAVCDAGWLPCRLQIGQTGKTVTPRLYIACGISGALQHLAGMRGSQCVVAINRDPRAAIFQRADIAVVEELVSFLPLLIEACRKRQPRAAEPRQ